MVGNINEKKRKIFNYGYSRVIRGTILIFRFKGEHLTVLFTMLRALHITLGVIHDQIHGNTLAEYPFPCS